ncbi:MAG: GspMb/PilO family protein [Acidobacteriota bacterium]|nr:GspMb/PilO family protein [Acidobacteriota bacterium]
MKKFNRREKTILRAMALVVIVALGSEVWEWYQGRRISLEGRISSLTNQIATMEKKLEGQDKQSYLEEAAEIEEELVDAKSMVLELRDETSASLLMRQTISELADAHGIKINSISSRKTRSLGDKKNDDSELKELRVYFGYDTDLASLVNFFNALEEEEYFLVIDTLNISARRRPRTRRTNKKTKTRLQTRSPLNGNAVLTTVFKANPEADAERYMRDRSVEKDDDDEESEETPATDETKASGLTPVDPPQPKTVPPKNSMGEGGALKTLGNRNAPPPRRGPPPPQKSADKPPLEPKPKPLTSAAVPKGAKPKPLTKAKSKDKGKGENFDPKKRF